MDASCYQESDGSIDITVIGGNVPYTFDWSEDGTGDFDDTEDQTNLSAGTYTVVVRDVKGCETTATYTITEPDELLIVNAIVTDVTCFGDSDGSIELDVIGGTLPYEYDWNNDGIGDFNDPQDLF